MSKVLEGGVPVHDLFRHNAIALADAELAPRSCWSDAGDGEHFVQFYDTDDFLLNSLCGFVRSGLEAGDACVVVATKSHRDALDEGLRACGFDVAAPKASGQFIALDASETLSEFMAGGQPEPVRFAEVIGGILAHAARDGRRVRVFGEMVDLLWAEQNHGAAISLERLWNDLQQTRPFQLFCAYPANRFGGDALAAPLLDVCSSHSRVIPAESYAALDSADARLRAIIELQQKAASLEAVKDELETQVEDLRRLHEMSVGLTGTLEVEAVLREVLRSALAVQGTDMGLLSLYEPDADGLSVEAHSGFGEEFLKEIALVPRGAGACGTCYEQRRRVVVEDVETDPLFAPYREAARAAGFRAVHSTPLVTRAGNIIGVLSVHFSRPHRPSDRETRLIDLYARMAADIIENARLHRRVQEELAERARALASEQAARAEAEAANRMKDEFLATVSHELRTPLNAIIGWSHMLRSESFDEATVSRALATIERNAHSQAQLIEDILDVSRVVAGKLRLNVGPVDLASVINAAVDSVQLAADTKGIRLGVALDPSARHVSGDAGRLQQVVWNLLSNAIKFTPEGGRVEVRLGRDGRDVQIKVSDTGQGVAPEFLPHVFDRFRQADGTSTRRHGGLGLGLSIVRHLVELHGGTVTADSPGAGLGASFIITLPPAPSSARGRRGIAAALPGEEAGARHAPLTTLEGVRVLLVDDDRDTLGMLAAVLTACRATVQTASSADDALEALRWFKPDVLVSDLAMPGEDGYSLIGRLRSLDAEAGGKIPAVALTAYVRVKDRTRALSAGFNMFVPKPVEPNELIAAVANLAESAAN
ncbi:MAG TPA: ATP-binding protein [Pyrinomonadaceae bacterium]|nr:ATP-binding protein [Pyrinomonadaceae bacterium]